MALLLLLFLLLLPISTTASCDPTQLHLLSSAFEYVSAFNTSRILNCSELRLPSSNLSGTISWQHLRNLTTLAILDLSFNSLHGRIPPTFWESTSLLEVNLSSNHLGGALHLDITTSTNLLKLDLSHNRFTTPVSLRGFHNLQHLDLSFNSLTSLPDQLSTLTKLEHLALSNCNLSGISPRPISNLTSLKFLDLSGNNMNGTFPSDFPPIHALSFLNLSFNNFSGEIGILQFQRFGNSSFAHSGISLQHKAENPHPHAIQTQRHPSKNTTQKGSATNAKKSEKKKKEKNENKKKEKNKEKKKKEERSLSLQAELGISIGISTSCVLLLISVICCVHRRKTKGKKKAKKLDQPFNSDVLEQAWVTEARTHATAARVAMFEKPLMQLTFSNLEEATSGFSRDAQLADGDIYRAVLPGDMHVAVKRVPARQVADLTELKHPNLLPLLGHCLAAGSSLLVYPYMDNGDLRRWLREPPLTAAVNVDEWSPEEDPTGWPTRFRIALGVARGVAYLHHAGRVHGVLNARRVLLADDLEPRIYYTASGTTGPTTGDDVYGYGVLLVELLSGLVGSVDVVRRIRGLVREGRASTALDDRVVGGSDGEEEEMVEALRVAYLCTAEITEKRPSMSQVVAMLKDVRSLAVI